MATTVVLLLPMGALSMRIFGLVWLHGLVQIFSLCALFSGFGLGIRLAQMKYMLYNTTHTIFGTVIVCLFLIQPFLGLLHHKQFQRIGKRGILGHIHLWYGRILIVLAVINGGLGLKLAANTTNGKIVYAVITAVIAVLYFAIILVTGLMRAGKDRSK